MTSTTSTADWTGLEKSYKTHPELKTFDPDADQAAVYYRAAREIPNRPGYKLPFAQVLKDLIEDLGVRSKPKI